MARPSTLIHEATHILEQSTDEARRVRLVPEPLGAVKLHLMSATEDSQIMRGMKVATSSRARVPEGLLASASQKRSAGP
jgi:hypothetical protein